VRINDTQRNVLVGFSFAPDTLIEHIQMEIELRLEVPVDSQRLIFGGKELDPTKTLEELNIATKEVLFLLRRQPHVCREWAATGACSRGRRCYQKVTHTMEFSPRYVEHHHKISEAKTSSESSSASSSKDSSPTASPPSTSPPCTPKLQSQTLEPATPPQPKPPIQPRPPSYGSIGAGKRRPAYGALGRAVRASASTPGEWEESASKPAPKPNMGATSNSGEWDGLVNDIASAMDGVHIVEEELELGEFEQSWDEGAFSSLGAPAICCVYDSSYDSSVCDGAADEIQKALSELSCEAAQGAPTPVLVETVPAPSVMDQKAAGMEFSSGVHLIDEMENQVREWEETEAKREEAYKAFVESQMSQQLNQTAVQTKGVIHGAPVRVF